MCQQKLPHELFPKLTRSNDGLNARCKACINKVNREYRIYNSQKFSAMRKRHYRRHRERLLKSKHSYYVKNRARKQAYDRDYRQKNSKKIAEQKAIWESLHRLDPKKRIVRNIRRRIHHAIARDCVSLRTIELIGCTVSELKEHLEVQFTNGMSWDNYGKWHIDHIRPCYSFDLTDTHQLKLCFHYSNCRPLWAKENLSRKRPGYIDRPSVLLSRPTVG